jgi:hypothetical protein
MITDLSSLWHYEIILKIYVEAPKTSEVELLHVNRSFAGCNNLKTTVFFAHTTLFVERNQAFVPYHREEETHPGRIVDALTWIVLWNRGFDFRRYRPTAGHLLQGCVTGLTEELPDLSPAWGSCPHVILNIRNRQALGEGYQDGSYH